MISNKKLETTPEGGGANFSNTVLDVCSNPGAKREMEGAPISTGEAGHHLPPSLATALRHTSLQRESFVIRVS